jgi:hypothetical protein
MRTFYYKFFRSTSSYHYFIKTLALFICLSGPGTISAQSYTICAGSVITLTATNPLGLTSPSYTLLPGNSANSNPTFVLSPTATATYTLITGGNLPSPPNTYTTTSVVNTVTVNKMPVIAPTVTQASCSNTITSVNLNLSWIPSGSTSYTIGFPPGQAPTGWTGLTQTTHSGTIAPGVYSPTVMSSTGCSVTGSFTINAQPASAFFNLNPSGSNYSITCTQPTVNISATTPNLSYTWTSASSSPITGSMVALTGTNVGTWTVSANNPLSGCIKTLTFSLQSAVVIPTSVMTPSFQTINCSSSSISNVTITSTSPTVNILHQVISPLGSTFTSNSPTIGYQPGTAGTYTSILTNIFNGCSIVKTFTVFSSQALPTFVPASTNNFSLGCSTKSTGVITISNAATPMGSALTYTILSPGSSTALPSGLLSTTNTLLVTNPGTYTMVVRDNANGCESRAPVTITTNTFAPVIDSISVPQNVLNCYNPQIVLTGYSGSANSSFLWTFTSAPGSATTNSLLVTANSSPTSTLNGNYSLTLTDNNNLCKSSTVVPIYQNLFPPKAIISSGSQYSITCTTPTILLSNNSISTIPPGGPGSIVVAVQWTGPLPLPTLSMSSTYTASIGGTYTLSVMDTGNGCTSSTTAIISDNRVLPIVNNPVGPPPFCLTSQVVVIYPIISSSTVGLTYTWTSPPTATPLGVNNFSLLTNAIGVYTISVSNPEGCIVHAQVSVSSCTDVSVFDNYSDGSFVVLPNPSNGIFNIDCEINSGSNYKAEIFNLLGSLVRTLEITISNKEIDLTDQQNGIYIIHISGNGQRIHTGRLIKN